MTCSLISPCWWEFYCRRGSKRLVTFLRETLNIYALHFNAISLTTNAARSKWEAERSIRLCHVWLTDVQDESRIRSRQIVNRRTNSSDVTRAWVWHGVRVSMMLHLVILVQAHAVIDSRGGIWTKSAVRLRARLTINQDNETNASISNSRYRSNISVRVSRITDTVRPKRFKKNKLCESWISQIGSFSKLNKPDRLILKIFK
jgi:hypothetical protein